MKVRSLAHLSDLHLGKSADTERRAIMLRDALVEANIDHVVVTGDITHRGRVGELALFWRIFAPLAADDRLTVVPGNHDRLGDNVAEAIHASPRVVVARAPGLHLVCFDSTAEHNRSWLNGHGAMAESDVAEISRHARVARPETLVAVLLHHHVLPLPGDHPAERLASWLGWPFADELENGPHLVDSLRGHCDLVLHGHRHRPGSIMLDGATERPLSIFNAGSSSELCGARVFWHDDGRLVGSPAWMTGRPKVPRPSAIHAPMPQWDCFPAVPAFAPRVAPIVPRADGR